MVRAYSLMSQGFSLQTQRSGSSEYKSDALNEQKNRTCADFARRLEPMVKAGHRVLSGWKNSNRSHYLLASYKTREPRESTGFEKARRKAPIPTNTQPRELRALAACGGQACT
jgi:hypothetical protein